MAKFCALASSSSGNSTYISCMGTSVLVDAGISCRRIFDAVSLLGEQAQDISAVLITHEHTDHIKGLKNFIKKSGARVYATAPVLEYIARNGFVEPNAQLCEVGKTPFEIGGIEVSSFLTPHDSACSVGYRLKLQNDTAVAVATDLGDVTEEVRNGVLGCKTVLLEANYDPQLLRMGSYPYFLKQRISCGSGHLANEKSAAFAAELVKNGTTSFVLGHLSRENNNPALARQIVENTLLECGAREGTDFELDVAPYDAAARLLRF